MSGKLIRAVHKCVQPKILPEWNDETLWQCECGKTWEIITSWDKQVWFTTAKAHWLKTNRKEIPKHNRLKCSLCVEKENK